MAVSVAELAGELRITDGASEPPAPIHGILTRSLDAANALIEKVCPDAPDAIKDECAIRVCAYWFDQPTAPNSQRYASAWRNSGASALAARWITHNPPDVSND